MNAARVVLLLSPLVAAPIAQAGNEAGAARPGNINVIALPAVQKPATDVPPAAIKSITTVQPKILSPAQPGRLQPKMETGPQPTAKILPPMDSIATDRKQPSHIHDRVGQQPAPAGDRIGAIKQSGTDSGPMLSALDDPRKPVIPKRGANGVSQSDLEKAQQKYQDARDSLDELGADKSMRLQKYQDARMAYYKALSDAMKKDSDTANGIVSNLK